MNEELQTRERPFALRVRIRWPNAYRQVRLASKIENSIGLAAVAKSPAVKREQTAPEPTKRGPSLLMRAWEWVLTRSKAEQKSRKLRICESTQLGEKKFIALIQADGQRYLIGATSNSITLLAELPQQEEFRSFLPKDTPLKVQER